MRTYLICISGIPAFLLNAPNRTAARSEALKAYGFTATGPAPRGLLIATV